MNENELSDIRVSIAQHDEKFKTIFNQLDSQSKLIESVHELATSVKLLTQAQKSTDEKVGKLASDIDEIKTKPGKRWDTVISVCVTALVTALVTYVLTQIGMK